MHGRSLLTWNNSIDLPLCQWSKQWHIQNNKIKRSGKILYVTYYQSFWYPQNCKERCFKHAIKSTLMENLISLKWESNLPRGHQEIITCMEQSQLRLCKYQCICKFWSNSIRSFSRYWAETEIRITEWLADFCPTVYLVSLLLPAE